jgi:hypothetical protein
VEKLFNEILLPSAIWIHFLFAGIVIVRLRQLIVVEKITVSFSRGIASGSNKLPLNLQFFCLIPLITGFLSFFWIVVRPSELDQHWSYLIAFFHFAVFTGLFWYARRMVSSKIGFITISIGFGGPLIVMTFWFIFIDQDLLRFVLGLLTFWSGGSVSWILFSILEVTKKSRETLKSNNIN